MSKLQVAVVILNWNGLTDTLECLKSISQTQNPHLKLSVYIVDNASSDASIKVISKKYPQYHLIANSKNIGFSGGNNVGIKAAIADGTDWIILLNNDTIVDKNCFDQLITGALKSHFDLASPKIYFYPGKEFHHADYQPQERGHVIWYAGGRNDWPNVWAEHVGVDEVDHGQFDQAQITGFASGCCLAINHKVTKKIGLLDTGFTAYFEDNDYNQRARKHGFTIGYIPSAIVWHKNAGSTGGSGSAKQKKLIDQSRLRFALKHAPFRAKLAVIKLTLLNHLHQQ